MIYGVETCGNGTGYCLLGIDCTLDDEFLPDGTGHCDGLSKSFTPSAHFTCCQEKLMEKKPPFLETETDELMETSSPQPPSTAASPLSDTKSDSIVINNQTVSMITTNRPPGENPDSGTSETTHSSGTTTPNSFISAGETLTTSNLDSPGPDVFVDIDSQVLKEVTPPSHHDIHNQSSINM